MSVAYAVLGVPILVFSIVVLLNLGRWSSLREALPTPLRLTLGVLWLATGCGLLIAAALHKVTSLVWTPAVVAAVIFFYFLHKTRHEGGR